MTQRPAAVAADTTDTEMLFTCLSLEKTKYMQHAGKGGAAAACRRFTWDVELAGVNPVEVQVEPEADCFDGDQGEKVDDRNGAWSDRE